MAKRKPRVLRTVRLAPTARGPGQELGPELLIEPVKTRIRLRHVASMGPVVRVLAVRDFKVRFKQSLLGPLWLVLQPLALLAAFLVGFHSVAAVGTDGVSYVVFVLVALGAWSYFQACLTTGSISLISNAQIIQRTACPRLAFPIASLIAGLPSVAIPLVAGMVAATVTGEISLRVLLLPVGLLWLFAVTAGTVTLVSALTLRYRDLLAILPLILQVGVFFSPIGYQSSDLPGIASTLIGINPLAGVMETWRWMILPIDPPDAGLMILSTIVTIVLLTAGWLVFTRSEPRMADLV